MNYSIIVPFYNEADNVPKLNGEIIEIIKNFYKESERKFELIYIDDGSEDNTFEELKKIKNNQFPTRLIQHKYNLSQSSALFTGIHFAKYNNLIFLDGDLQNDPRDIGEMIKIFETGYDMVAGWRKNRKDEFLYKTFPSLIANYFVRLFSNSKIHDHGCGLKILKKEIIDYRIAWGDFHRLLSARASLNKCKIKEIVVNHRPRIYGKSNYNISRMFRVFLDLIFMNFFKSDGRPAIYFFGKFGLLSFFASSFSFFYMIFLKIFNNVDIDQTPLPLLTVFLFLMGFLFLFIGLLAQLIVNQSSNENSIKNSIKEMIE